MSSVLLTKKVLKVVGGGETWQLKSSKYFWGNNSRKNTPLTYNYVYLEVSCMEMTGSLSGVRKYKILEERDWKRAVVHIYKYNILEQFFSELHAQFPSVHLNTFSVWYQKIFSFIFKFSLSFSFLCWMHTYLNPFF